MNRLSKKDICNLPALIKKSAPDGQKALWDRFLLLFEASLDMSSELLKVALLGF